MRKRMWMAAVCLLAFASGCAQTQEEPSTGKGQAATAEVAGAAAEDTLYELSAETPQGLYNVNGGRGQYFLDYATGENRPLCVEPGGSHTGDTCSA